MTISTFAINGQEIGKATAAFIGKHGRDIGEKIVKQLKEVRKELKDSVKMTSLPSPSDVIVTAASIEYLTDTLREIGKIISDEFPIEGGNQFQLNAQTYELVAKCLTIQHENLRVTLKNLLEEYKDNPEAAHRILAYASAYVPRVLGYGIEAKIIEKSNDVATVVNAAQNFAKAHYLIAAVINTCETATAEEAYPKFMDNLNSFICLAIEGKGEVDTLNTVVLKDSDELASICALALISASASFVVPFVTQYFRPANKK